MNFSVATQQTETEASTGHQVSRNPHGFVRLLGISGLLMALALPIGVYPRMLQSAELDKAHRTAVEQLPEVSVTQAVPAPATRQVSLPGNIEAELGTGIYARRDGYIRHRYADIGDTVKAGQLLADIESPEIDESANEARALVLTNSATKTQAQANFDKAKADMDTATANVSQSKANLVE